MKFLLLFIISFSVNAQKAAIFNGDSVKILKEKLKFKTEKTIESGSIDPSAVATPGDNGSLFLRDNGNLYVKQDDGMTTNWLPLSKVGSPWPVMAKGSIVTSNGSSNGEFTACANGEILEWDSAETAGVKCGDKTVVPALNYELSSSSGVFSTTSSTYVDVTNLAVTITTTGGPILVKLVSDGSGGQFYINETGTGNPEVSLVRGAITLLESGLFPNVELSPSVLSVVDEQSSGTYTYKIRAKNSGGGLDNTNVSNAKLFAQELK